MRMTKLRQNAYESININLPLDWRITKQNNTNSNLGHEINI